MKIGLLGNGYWGKILSSKLEQVDDVEIVWVYTSKDTILFDNTIDWVFIATPNDIHYEQAKYFIEQGVNVFCEKPLTPTYKQSKELFDLAEKYDVKLYVDDVFNYRNEQNDIKNLTKPIEVVWNKVSDNTLYDLMYHDLYLLQPHWTYLADIKFSYGQSDDRTHKINDLDFTTSENSNDALLDMLNVVLYGTPNYEYNKTISLMCNEIIDNIIEKEKYEK